jgi:hypothetical protein
VKPTAEQRALALAYDHAARRLNTLNEAIGDYLGALREIREREHDPEVVELINRQAGLMMHAFEMAEADIGEDQSSGKTGPMDRLAMERMRAGGITSPTPYGAAAAQKEVMT